MSDLYGATPVPLVAASPQGTDPFTHYVLSYMQAIANAKASLEWASIAPLTGGTPKPVLTIFDHDPERAVFNTNKLPALYLFRSKVVDRIQVAQEIRVESGEMTLLWMPPLASQDSRRVRSNFAAKLFKILDDYVERERDPAWLVAGDTDPSAAAYGSNLAVWALYRRFHLGQTVRRDLSIRKDDKGPPELFEAYACTCPYEEQLSIDASRYWADDVRVDIDVPGSPSPIVVDQLILQ